LTGFWKFVKEGHQASEEDKRERTFTNAARQLVVLEKKSSGGLPGAIIII